MIELTDTHCHIQEACQTVVSDNGVQGKWAAAGINSPEPLIATARAAGVTRLVCVGTTTADSELAVQLAAKRPQVWAAIGIHPHEAGAHLADDSLRRRFEALLQKPKVVAIGECGLDYFYDHASPAHQLELLHYQLELAVRYDLPLIFHVREAFKDFWPVFDAHPGLRGVIHSFSATTDELQAILSRGLFVGLNGIMTFTKREEQLQAAKAIPLDRLLLETDAPFLTPSPLRGSVCMPKHLRLTAEFLTKLRNESLDTLAATTTHNARTLFGF